MRERGSWIVGTMALLAVLWAGPARGISLDFVPSSTMVMPGETFQVELHISGLPDGQAPSVGSYILNVFYDSMVLFSDTLVFGDPTLGNQLDPLQLGTLADVFTGPGFITGSEDASFMTPSSALDQNQPGSFVLFTIVFEALASGTSDLSTVISSIRDADDGILDVTDAAGSATVIPEPATLWLLAAGLASLATRRRRTTH